MQTTGKLINLFGIYIFASDKLHLVEILFVISGSKRGNEGNGVSIDVSHQEEVFECIPKKGIECLVKLIDRNCISSISKDWLY